VSAVCIFCELRVGRMMDKLEVGDGTDAQEFNFLFADDSPTEPNLNTDFITMSTSWT
jgi:hypothetical protein